MILKISPAHLCKFNADFFVGGEAYSAIPYLSMASDDLAYFFVANMHYAYALRMHHDSALHETNITVALLVASTIYGPK